MNLLDELRRRNVIRVAGFYLVAAWLVVQVAETLLPAFDVPGWVLRAIIVVLALGFIPAVVLAWAFELTPQGIKRERDIDRSTQTVDPTARRLDIAVIVLLLGVAAVTWFRPGAGPDPSAPSAQPGASAPTVQGTDDSAPLRSIAVLAFDDLSAERDQAYFAEGISEELLNLLARIDGLQVAARTSSFKFRDSSADIGEIGRALGVDAVVEGSVRKAGDQIRITAQLIKTRDGFHLWSQSYDRKLENIFAVQDEIATAIVQALKLELDLAEETAGRTGNVEAFDLYLRGRHQARAPTREGLLQAIALYDQALALDPGFAAAHSGIAEAWIWLEDYGGFRSTEAFPKAEQAARRALALDPQSAEANAAMAFVQDRYYNDHAQAQVLFERTLAINPNYVTAYNLYADTLRDMGQPRRMVEMQRRSVELDPLSVFFRARLAQGLMSTSHEDEASALIDAILAEAPDNDYGLEEQANLRRQQGRLAEAAALYRRVHLARPGDPFSAAHIAIFGAELDDAAMADAWIAAARARGADNRWELFGRQALALWRGDWTALDDVGSRRGGDFGAYLRGYAAAGEARWADARQALNESLRLGGYREGASPSQQNIAALLLLAWLEKRDGEPGWQARAREADAYLQRVTSEGGALIGTTSSVAFESARSAALAGEREQSLELLRGSVADSGFRHHWFLQRDPLFAQWRDDPEFRALVEQMRSLAAAERERVIADGLQAP